jgi:RimJ/RimL family protein N-acetyltransferase
METVRIEPWQSADLWLLQRANTAEMTRFLGAAESAEDVEKRHAKYLRLWESGEARMFRIVVGDEAVGGIGWWSSEWDGKAVHESGWFVLPERQGRGIASAALELVVADARKHGMHPLLAAFPSVENVASNRVCARAGFELVDTEKEEFRGVLLHLNVWALDLRATGSSEQRQNDGSDGRATAGEEIS